MATLRVSKILYAWYRPGLLLSFLRRRFAIIVAQSIKKQVTIKLSFVFFNETKKNNFLKHSLVKLFNIRARLLKLNLEIKIRI